MHQGESAFQFTEDRERHIHERMLLVGVGPAAFYRDACRILRLDPPLATTTHLVRHCLREIESCAGYLGHLFTKSGAICQHDLSCLPYRLHKKYICEER